MAWVKMHDQVLLSKGSIFVRGKYGPDMACRMHGFLDMGIAQSGAEETDGFVPDAVWQMVHPTRWRKLLEIAVEACWLEQVLDRPDGQPGHQLRRDNGIWHLRYKAEIKKDREKRAATKSVGNRVRVLLRDGDQCRYCLLTVWEPDHHDNRGRTWEHPDPTDRDTFVVACRSCNGAKHERTVEQWVAIGGHDLKPPPLDRGDRLFLQPETVTFLLQHRAQLPRDYVTTSDAQTAADEPARAPGAAHPGADRQPPTAPSAAPTEAVHEQVQSSPQGLPGPVPPGRDGIGSGRVTPAVQADSSPTTPRGSPRRRGTRGGRNRRPPPTTGDARA